MHELGIVFYIIRDVKQVAEENQVTKVNSVTLEVGEVSGVIPYYLEDCWNWAVKKETVLNGAKLISQRQEAVTHCDDCGHDYQTVRYGKTCPHCGGGNTWLLRGNQVTIKEIEAM